MDDCKNCEGTGVVRANGAPRECPVCEGWGYVGQRYVTDPEIGNYPMTGKQAGWVFVIAGIVIFIAFILGGVGA